MYYVCYPLLTPSYCGFIKIHFDGERRRVGARMGVNEGLAVLRGDCTSTPTGNNTEKVLYKRRDISPM